MLPLRSGHQLILQTISRRTLVSLNLPVRSALCLPAQKNTLQRVCVPKPASILYRLSSSKTPPDKPSQPGGSSCSPSSEAELSSDDESDNDNDNDDYDSDYEPEGTRAYGKRGTSKLWLSKIRTYHRIMDVNKDGTVSWDDFREMADRFAQYGHLSQQQQADFIAHLRLLWETSWGASDDPYCFINEQSLVTSMTHVVNTPELCRKVHKFLPFLFKAVDYNSSGDISIDEYILLFKCLGLSEKHALVSFRAIDANSSGTITLDEFVRSGRSFFLSEDDKDPSYQFWGPLTG